MLLVAMVFHVFSSLLKEGENVSCREATPVDWDVTPEESCMELSEAWWRSLHNPMPSQFWKVMAYVLHPPLYTCRHHSSKD